MGPLTGLAFSIAQTVEDSGGSSIARRRAIDAQWNAIVMLDEEIRKYGHTNRTTNGALVSRKRFELKVELDRTSNEDAIARAGRLLTFYGISSSGKIKKVLQRSVAPAGQ